MTLQYIPLKTFGLITGHIEAKINKRKSADLMDRHC